MTKKNEIYKCNKCGNIVEFVIASGVPVVCCGEKMELLVPKTADATGEKHVPFIEEVSDGYLVSVGKEVEHPMTDDHYIQFIELVIDGKLIERVELAPSDSPKYHFRVEKGNDVLAREYCNIHGLWSNK